MLENVANTAATSADSSFPSLPGRAWTRSTRRPHIALGWRSMKYYAATWKTSCLCWIVTRWRHLNLRILMRARHRLGVSSVHRDGGPWIAKNPRCSGDISSATRSRPWSCWYLTTWTRARRVPDIGWRVSMSINCYASLWSTPVNTLECAQLSFESQLAPAVSDWIQAL
jgi:hypothetical protein